MVSVLCQGDLVLHNCSLPALEDLLQDGIPIDVVYLDFTKAFDSVLHKHHLVKLQAHGITGKLLNWIKVFL